MIPTHRVARSPWILVALLLAGSVPAASGCSRQLNDRYRFEHREAAAGFREQGVHDIRNHRLSEALANFTEAIRIDPADAESHWNVGRIYLTIGRFEKAERYFARAVSIDKKTYGEMQPEAIPVANPEVAAALIEGRQPPDDADWVADE